MKPYLNLIEIHSVDPNYFLRVQFLHVLFLQRFCEMCACVYVICLLICLFHDTFTKFRALLLNVCVERTTKKRRSAVSLFLSLCVCDFLFFRQRNKSVAHIALNERECICGCANSHLLQMHSFRCKIFHLCGGKNILIKLNKIFFIVQPNFCGPKKRI